MMQHSLLWYVGIFFFITKGTIGLSPTFSSRCIRRSFNRHILCAVAEKTMPSKFAKGSSPQSTATSSLPSQTKRYKRSLSSKKPPKATKSMVCCTWRLYNLVVPLDQDPGKDHHTLHPSILNSVSKVLRKNITESDYVEQILDVNPVVGNVTATSHDIGPDEENKLHISIVRKSFDCRERLPQPQFVYTVDVTVPVGAAHHTQRLVAKEGVAEVMKESETATMRKSSPSPVFSNPERTVVVVGAGPAGLFAALQLLEAGVKPIVLERGKGVEQRGKSIGALFNRKLLDPESNLCYGEGGAGTWSDGKLTTRIGKNSRDVRAVLETLVRFGAPRRILVDGKPHLGTDRLVRILKNMREYLLSRGAEIYFDARVEHLVVEQGEMKKAKGVQLSNGDIVTASDGIILSVGHSARNLYEHLHQLEVPMVAKPIAVGFRIEHPQELINRIQYGADYAGLCQKGQGPIPVADYRLAVDVVSPITSTTIPDEKAVQAVVEEDIYREKRGCYSFCMCPGGQIVPTTVRTEELCINGMSFSKRQSAWANSALVVAVSPYDMTRSLDGLMQEEMTVLSLKYRKTNDDARLAEECWWEEDSFQVSEADKEILHYMHTQQIQKKQTTDALIGVWWQRLIERRASRLGGGQLVVPVQRATDFVNAKVATDATAPSLVVVPSAIKSDTAAAAEISSSYRLGVREAPCHTLYPSFITEALQRALEKFEHRMPGFLCADAILHGVETRTSAPVQLSRDAISCESVGMSGLYPAGEGAGYAGGIISAAVDGLRVAQAIVNSNTSPKNTLETTETVTAEKKNPKVFLRSNTDHFY